MILIVGGPGPGKTKALFNLLGHQPNIDKMFLYANDLYQAKYQMLNKKRKGLKI